MAKKLLLFEIELTEFIKTTNALILSGILAYYVIVSNVPGCYGGPNANSGQKNEER